MTTVLVTGASGWLGRHLIPLLRDRGYRPHGLDIAPSKWADTVGSVQDRDLIHRLFRERTFDAVIHAGALHKPDIARFSSQEFIDVNVTGTLTLLEAAAARPGTRFIFTSTTSLMISQRIRDEQSDEAIWLDETAGPLEPRNIYGVTKLAAEGLCRQQHLQNGVPVIVLRTARFFPEDDDTITAFSGANLKANELLHRRATVVDIARAHITALERAEAVGFGLYVVSAPSPFSRSDLRALKNDAAKRIATLYPDAMALFDRIGWRLAPTIGRVYDGSRIERELGFRYRTRFEDVLEALRHDRPLPFTHDPTYTSPLQQD